ncbi:MAG TPA: hypothetical protein VEV38_14530, partial [Candidatus Eremiobacteraceae bacterium]|nr:hypothetical protein [Candidatus Eremiobacteraceae bacterium]
HSISKLFETLDLQREGEFLQRRHMARLAWQLPRDLRNGLADSFARWRRGHVFATERHAAIAMAVATHDMNAFDREESVIEALLKWLRDRETLPPDPRPREGVLSASAYRERWYTPVRRRFWSRFP